VSNVSCFSWWCSSSRQLSLFSCCGAASTTFLVLWLSSLWAVCLHASLNCSHPYLAVLWNCCGLSWFVPQWLNRTDAKLGPKLNDANGNLITKVWEY
jgi:hypothetical protein